MWHTNNGDRTLEGAEARLFAGTLHDFITKMAVFDGDYDTGLEVFDRLEFGQKFSLLSVIGNGLLKPDVPMHKLTAAVESAIAAVFNHLKAEVCIEIDEPEIQSNWRKMILAARRQAGGEELPEESCEDYEEWDIEIECLASMILWDSDYEDERLFLDKPPEEAREFKGIMGMSDDYFLEIPEDLKPEQIKAKLAELKKLCQLIR